MTERIIMTYLPENIPFEKVKELAESHQISASLDDDRRLVMKGKPELVDEAMKKLAELLKGG